MPLRLLWGWTLLALPVIGLVALIWKAFGYWAFVGIVGALLVTWMIVKGIDIVTEYH